MRRVLLDTHVLLWWLGNHAKLGATAIGIIGDARNMIYVSAISNWEISIKKSLGKLAAPDDMDSIVEDKGFIKLPISNFHGDLAGALPNYHNDPFDRMLIVQAQAEGLEIMTKDIFFPRYAVKTINALK
jgi:PIN domain nuclease of toxin-antitoxin system